MSLSADPHFPTMAWGLELGATALLVIDPQNDFLHPEGWYGANGVDISHMRRTIEPTRALVQSARAKRIPVIWTQHGFHNESDGGLFLEMRPFLAEGGLRIGTWGYQILEELEPAAGDWRIHKNRLSAFYGTNLELLLRGLGVRTVLVVGVLTNQCVAATSKDAYYRDIKPIVVEEATGTTLPHLHAPAIEMIQVGWGAVHSLTETLTNLEELGIPNC